MTTFGDMVYALGGVPLLPGLPITPKESLYYWVDVTFGNDGNTGTKQDEPLQTLAEAFGRVNDRINWSRSRWATCDAVIVAPGVYPENITSLPYGATVIGLGDAYDLNGQRGVTIKPASGAPVNVTSCINARLQNLCFESPDTSAAFEVDNLNRTLISHCLFAGVPGSSPSSVYGLRVIKDMTGSRISDSDFLVFNHGIHITTDNANSKQASGDIIERCNIRGCDLTGVHFDANCVPSMTIITDCNIGDGSTTLAQGLDDDSGLVGVFNTNFEATAVNPASGAGHYNKCYLNGGLIT